MFFGLKVAKQMGFTKVILEVDSLCAVQLGSEVPLEFHACRPLIMAVRNLCQSIGEVQIVHQFREANACADTLAKLGHGLQPGSHVLPSLPSCVQLFFMQTFRASLILGKLLRNFVSFGPKALYSIKKKRKQIFTQ